MLARNDGLFAMWKKSGFLTLRRDNLPETACLLDFRPMAWLLLSVA